MRSAILSLQGTFLTLPFFFPLLKIKKIEKEKKIERIDKI